MQEALDLLSNSFLSLFLFWCKLDLLIFSYLFTPPRQEHTGLLGLAGYHLGLSWHGNSKPAWQPGSTRAALINQDKGNLHAEWKWVKRRVCLKTTCTWTHFLNIFFFASGADLFDCTNGLMENKFGSIWNSWVDSVEQPSLSPCLFVFLLQEGWRSCWLRRYLFCLLLQTSWRLLTADGQKWDKPEAAARSCFLTNCLYLCQVICFRICYRGTLSYLVFWLSEKCFLSEESSAEALHLAFGGATCPARRLLWAAEECISWNEPGTDRPLKGAWFSVQ